MSRPLFVTARALARVLFLGRYVRAPLLRCECPCRECLTGYALRSRSMCVRDIHLSKSGRACVFAMRACVSVPVPLGTNAAFGAGKFETKWIHGSEVRPRRHPKRSHSLCRNQAQACVRSHTYHHRYMLSVVHCNIYHAHDISYAYTTVTYILCIACE